METPMTSDAPAQRVFISYSTSDRARVEGLVRLLDLFGHEVFIDHRSIRLGRRWREEIHRGLERADVMMVFWTRAASMSRWVKEECDYVFAHDPDLPVVPVIGDETPLTTVLAERQALDFLPVINELLKLRREMAEQGRRPGEIQQALCERLAEAGIRLEPQDRKRIFLFFGVSGWLAWLTSPLALADWGWRQFVDATAQFSAAQLFVILGAAGVAAAVGYEAGDAAESRLQARLDALGQQIEQERERSENSVAELASKLDEISAEKEALANAMRLRERDFEAYLDDLGPLIRLARSNVLLDVTSGAHPVSLQVVEGISAEHCCTVLLPNNRTISFFVPPGSYKAYYSLADVSRDLRTLMPETAPRGIVDLSDLQAGTSISLHETEISLPTGERDPDLLPWKEWGGAQSVE